MKFFEPDNQLAARSVAIVLIVAFAVGCAREVVEYPSNWAAVHRQSDCHAIVGTYHEKGERAADRLGGGFLRFTHLATHNELDFSGPYVTLSFPETGVLAI